MSHEILIETFSALSLKRRQGVLRTNTPVGPIEIALIEGKIVGVDQPGGKAAHEICGRLRRSGMIHEKVYNLFQGVNVNLSQLYDLLVSKKFVAPDKFNRARISYEMDLLHSLRFSEDPAPEFTAKDVRPDPRYSMQLPLGQLLLDIFELNTDDDRFQKMFFDAAGVPLVIKRKGGLPKGLSAYESSLWERLAQPARVDQIIQGLLSELEMREGLLVLADHGLLEIEKRAGAETSRSHSNGTAAPQITRAVVDDSFQLADADDLENDFFSRIAEEATGSLLSGFEDDLSLGDLHEAALDIGRPGMPVDRIVHEDAAHPSVLPGHAAAVSIETGTASLAPKEAITSELFSKKSFQAKMLDLNYRMSEKEARSKIIFCIIIAYLFAVLMSCLMPNGMIDSCFRALGDFTSN